MEAQEQEPKKGFRGFFSKKEKESELPSLKSLSGKEFVDQVNREIEMAENPPNLAWLLAHASIAEANGRLSIEEAKDLYGNLAIKAANIAGKAISGMITDASTVLSTSAVAISIKASNRLIRPETAKPPTSSSS